MAGRLQLAARSQANLIIGGLWHTLYPIFLLFLDQPPNTIDPSWSIKTPLPGRSHPFKFYTCGYTAICDNCATRLQQ